ncbi:MAG TPA: hypothetical protein DIU09_02285 [Hyphomonadaceae bacterium]|nr:hypothetical protein AEM38_10365 [Hyphomonadaceae bacterium UKL13-1]HCP63396.1 hypothetical protein [Hyphomonadaceae bacterium]
MDELALKAAAFDLAYRSAIAFETEVEADPVIIATGLVTFWCRRDELSVIDETKLMAAYRLRQS